jgi:hypothetical protein
MRPTLTGLIERVIEEMNAGDVPLGCSEQECIALGRNKSLSGLQNEFGHSADVGKRSEICVIKGPQPCSIRFLFVSFHSPVKQRTTSRVIGSRSETRSANLVGETKVDCRERGSWQM